MQKEVFKPVVTIPLLKSVLKIIDYRLKHPEKEAFESTEIHKAGGNYTDYAFRYMQDAEVAYNDGYYLYLESPGQLVAFKEQASELLRTMKRETRWRRWEVHLGFAGFVISFISLIVSMFNVSLGDFIVKFIKSCFA